MMNKQTKFEKFIGSNWKVETKMAKNNISKNIYPLTIFDQL